MTEKELIEVREKPQRIVSELARLTTAGKAKWWRQKGYPQCLYCIVNDELFIFDTLDEEGRIHREMPGLSLSVRNRSFLWLTELNGWNEVINLLLQGKQNVINDEEYRCLLHRLDQKILKDLEAIA